MDARRMRSEELRRPEAKEILGVPIHLVDYASGIEFLKSRTKQPSPFGVSACNTHLISKACTDEDFQNLLAKFELNLPDGMPLLWYLRARGVHLRDRVYGPYFMRETIRQTPRPWKHFLFGGRQETLQKLQHALRKIQPDLEIVGTVSPPYRAWSPGEEEHFAEQIRNSGADFVWVALGGEKQERWIFTQLPRHDRAAFLAVGDAFELLAGNRPFAPALLQKLGLTWAFRLLQEPKRLWKRYLVNNALFVFFAIREAFLGKRRRRPVNGH